MTGSGMTVSGGAASDATPPLMLRHVKKHFGDFIAVADLSFKVPKGAIYGILGPNGAGKTTTLRMINNILVPDAGDVVFFGDLPPGTESSKRIGYLPEERGLYSKETVKDVLVFFGQLRGLSKPDSKKGADEWIGKLTISDWANERVENLSKGMQQKVQFATALIHKPELLILDEPWSGLDPINAQVLRDAVLEQKKQGKTVLFSTHLMEHAEEICDEVCILAKGKKILDGPLDELKRKEGGGRFVELRPADNSSQKALLAFLQQKKEWVEEVSVESGHVRCLLSQDGMQYSFMREVALLDIKLQKLEAYEPSLRDVFVKHVGELANTDVVGRQVE